MAEAIRLVLKEQDKLEERLRKLESSSGIATHQDDLRERRKKFEKELKPNRGK